MFSIDTFSNSQVSASLAMEHYRLHSIERWPDGAHKDAALASIRSTLAGLARCNSHNGAPWVCIVCEVRVPGTLNPTVLAVAA